MRDVALHAITTVWHIAYHIKKANGQYVLIFWFLPTTGYTNHYRYFWISLELFMESEGTDAGILSNARFRRSLFTKEFADQHETPYTYLLSVGIRSLPFPSSN